MTEHSPEVLNRSQFERLLIASCKMLGLPPRKALETHYPAPLFQAIEECNTRGLVCPEIAALSFAVRNPDLITCDGAYATTRWSKQAIDCLALWLDEQEQWTQETLKRMADGVTAEEQTCEREARAEAEVRQRTFQNAN